MARNPIHPGEHLSEALENLGVSPTELDRAVEVPANRISGILHVRRAITADTALRLGRYFGTSQAFWMNLQELYELRVAEHEIGDLIKEMPRAMGDYYAA